MVHYDVIDKLFRYYKSSEFCNRDAFVRRVNEDETVELSDREIELIWQAFDRAAEQWEPRIGGM